jgi:2-hydroxychromene-2-carboxylate isomerase
MNMKQACELVDKALKVIASCETSKQLQVAHSYTDKVYKELFRKADLIQNPQFIVKIERAIGFAQCKVKNNVSISSR